ncbi:unnamed protein product [Soboliphyme baturini]|uniref:Retinol dehydrogenase 14 n=1 Tax=Soboliphyme baturini TaxID=241478 RepID=A0A183J9C7_9BILA|nr:unnamed protein product [Soboliphyme baturini]
MLQVNHFGPFLFTNLLLDRIVESSPSRIVNVSSMASYWCSYKDFDDVKLDKTPFSGCQAYNLSKLENILFTRALARKLYEKKVTVNCLHPGLVATDIFRNVALWLVLLLWPFSKSCQEGSQTTIYLAVADEVEHVSGMYFDNCKPKIPPMSALDDSNVEKLWDCSEKVTGLKK